MKSSLFARQLIKSMYAKIVLQVDGYQHANQLSRTVTERKNERIGDALLSQKHFYMTSINCTLSENQTSFFYREESTHHHTLRAFRCENWIFPFSFLAVCEWKNCICTWIASEKWWKRCEKCKFLNWWIDFGMVNFKCRLQFLHCGKFRRNHRSDRCDNALHKTIRH